MTPTKKEKNHTVLRMERIKKSELQSNQSDVVHVAGGDHQGIIINKQATSSMC